MKLDVESLSPTVRMFSGRPGSSLQRPLLNRFFVRHVGLCPAVGARCQSASVNSSRFGESSLTADSRSAVAEPPSHLASSSGVACGCADL